MVNQELPLCSAIHTHRLCVGSRVDGVMVSVCAASHAVPLNFGCRTIACIERGTCGWEREMREMLRQQQQRRRRHTAIDTATRTVYMYLKTLKISQEKKFLCVSVCVILCISTNTISCTRIPCEYAFLLHTHTHTNKYTNTRLYECEADAYVVYTTSVWYSNNNSSSHSTIVCPFFTATVTQSYHFIWMVFCVWCLCRWKIIFSGVLLWVGSMLYGFEFNFPGALEHTITGHTNFSWVWNIVWVRSFVYVLWSKSYNRWLCVV